MDSQEIFQYFTRFVVVCTTLPFHEYAHAWMAYKLGDDTAAQQGRLNLNPLVHIDPFGAILLLLTGFGWAKPVPVNPRQFTRKVTLRGGMAITAAAGPLANILLGFIVMILYKLFAIIAIAMNLEFNGLPVIMLILVLMVNINISLAVFNLLPIPPLDGYSVAAFFLPATLTQKIAQYQQIIFGIMMAVLLFTDFLDRPIGFLANLLYMLLDKATFFMDFILQAVVH